MTNIFKTSFLVFLFIFGMLAVTAPPRIEKQAAIIKEEKNPLVEYIAKHNQSQAESIAESAVKWGKNFDIEPELLIAIARVESTFNPYAISFAGAMGIMQIIPKWHIEKIKTAKDVVGTPEIFNLDTSMFLGAWVLRDCMDKHKVANLALRCYNGSNNDKYANKVMSVKKEIYSHVKGDV
jgi:soluble lytic murein transglycosylase-like protein